VPWWWQSSSWQQITPKLKRPSTSGYHCCCHPVQQKSHIISTENTEEWNSSIQNKQALLICCENTTRFRLNSCYTSIATLGTSCSN
jgi:hypothetical protein